MPNLLLKILTCFSNLTKGNALLLFKKKSNILMYWMHMNDNIVF